VFSVRTSAARSSPYARHLKFCSNGHAVGAGQKMVAIWGVGLFCEACYRNMERYRRQCESAGATVIYVSLKERRPARAVRPGQEVVQTTRDDEIDEMEG
jgi:hypothetical protein